MIISCNSPAQTKSPQVKEELLFSPDTKVTFTRRTFTTNQAQRVDYFVQIPRRRVLAAIEAGVRAVNEDFPSYGSAAFMRQRLPDGTDVVYKFRRWETQTGRYETAQLTRDETKDMLLRDVKSKGTELPAEIGCIGLSGFDHDDGGYLRECLTMYIRPEQRDC